MSQRKVPSLSLKDYSSSDPAVRQKFIDDLYNSFKEYGFVVIKDHSIPIDLMQKAYKLQEQLFSLPVETKNKYIMNNGGQRGYTPFGTEHAKDAKVSDLKEFFHIGRDYKETEPEATLYPQNVWINDIPEFKDTFKKLYAQLENVGDVLLEALTPSLEVPKDFFKTRTYNGNTVMRLLHYPPIPDHLEPGQVRAGRHTDINLITLLLAAQGGGLQLQDKDGQWLEVGANPDEIAVNMGDMLSRMTNDVLPSTVHQVVNPSDPALNKSRYSMPLFLHPRKGVILSELPKFKGQGTKYPDIESDEFLNQRLKEIGLKKK